MDTHTHIHRTTTVTLAAHAHRGLITSWNNDCGVFALAFCTSLARGEDLSDLKFNQDVMRKHLETCFYKKNLFTFPNFLIS